MKATVSFWDDSNDCVLDIPQPLGNTKHIIFESVSSCWKYAKKIGATITSIVLYSTNGAEVITQ